MKRAKPLTHALILSSLLAPPARPTPQRQASAAAGRAAAQADPGVPTRRSRTVPVALPAVVSQSNFGLTVLRA